MPNAMRRLSSCAAAIALFLAAPSLVLRAAAQTPPAGQRAASAPKKPVVRVTIGKQTTYLTEPLRPDGYPDYFAAINRRLSQGVTPANNSAVPFLKAIGPGCIPEGIREKYFQLLGISPLPAEGDYFVAIEDFAAREKRAGRTELEGDGDLSKQLRRLASRPWSRTAFPSWARWLEVNEKPLALAVEASKRPRCYEPFVPDGVGILLNAPKPAVLRSITFARALTARAMRRTDEGDLDGAWQDLLACHRLARLVSQGPMLVEGLVGISIDNGAMGADEALLARPGLTKEQIEHMRADLAALPAMPKMADRIDWGERCTFLDAVCFVAREGFNALSKGGGGMEPSKGVLDSLVASNSHKLIHWDVSLRMGNAWCDQFVEAARKPTRAERLEVQKKIQEELDEIRREMQAPEELLRLQALFNASNLVAKSLVPMLSTLGLGAEIEDRWAMRWQTTAVAFALAAYRAEHGAYPEKLTELVPKYIAKLPKDLFVNNADLHYSRQSDGCMVYSVGPNGKDEGGKTEEDRLSAPTPMSFDEWDDIGVRLNMEHR